MRLNSQARITLPESLKFVLVGTQSNKRHFELGGVFSFLANCANLGVKKERAHKLPLLSCLVPPQKVSLVAAGVALVVVHNRTLFTAKLM